MLDFLVTIRRQPDSTKWRRRITSTPGHAAQATPVEKSRKFDRVPTRFNRISRMQPTTASRVPRTQDPGSSNTTTYPTLILGQTQASTNAPQHRPHLLEPLRRTQLSLRRRTLRRALQTVTNTSTSKAEIHRHPPALSSTPLHHRRTPLPSGTRECPRP